MSENYLTLAGESKNIEEMGIDKEFPIKFQRGEYFGAFKNLPSIPQLYIEYFITEYNKGNQIKTVEVELEEDGDDCFTGRRSYSYNLKLNQNNEISIIFQSYLLYSKALDITKDEKKYSKEEVQELFEKYIDANKPILYPRLKENLK